MAEKYQGETVTQHHSNVEDDVHKTVAVKDASAAGAALVAAVEAQKPKLFSKGMIKLYFIMAIGYLVSTMNGFGRLLGNKSLCPRRHLPSV